MGPFFQVECPKCRSKNKSGARFCGTCGEHLPGSELKCSNCGATVAADRSFCGNCGKPLAESAAPLLTGNRWARRVEDFATKVEVDDVEGFFKKGLLVEAGTKAIFFVNGAYSGILDPGKYEMGGLLQKIKNVFNSKSTTAVLVDAADVELRLPLGGLQTRDPIKLAAECRLVIQLDNPTEFFENVMKGRQNYPLTELRSYLEDELRNCVQEFIGTKSVQELSGNLGFKNEIEQGVVQHLSRTFSRTGFTFVQVRVFDFRHPRLDALSERKEEYWLHAQDLQAKLAGEGSSLGLDRKLLDQETAKALMELEVYEDRAKVYERMRKAVASNQMNEVTNENELEKFMQSIDKDKLLRAEDMQSLLQDFGEKKEDHDMARRHLIQRLKIEQTMDLQRAALLGKIGLSRTVTESVRAEEMAQLDHELAARRRALESTQAEEWSQLKMGVDARRLQVESEFDLARKKSELEMDLSRKQADLGLDLGKKQADLELDLGRKQADAQFEVGRRQKLSDIELEELEDQKDLRTAAGSLDILKKQKGIKKEEEDWETERKLRERAALSEVSMREEAQRHQQEIVKIQALSSLSTEALIAAAPADRAAMLADLKRTDSLKGFSEEQILAMAADKSPEVARAFQEKFRGASSAEIQKAYERMLGMKDQGITDLKEMSREHARMMQEMFNRGMDTQRDTATAAARSAQPGMTVVVPGIGQPAVIQPGAGGAGMPGGGIGTQSVGAPIPEPPPPQRVVICPNCRQKIEESQKFCDNCAHQFYQ
jgi:hypothetical protein